MPLYKQIGAFQRWGAVNRRLRSPFARSDADLPLLKPVEEAILTSKPSSIRRMLVGCRETRMAASGGGAWKLTSSLA